MDRQTGGRSGGPSVGRRTDGRTDGRKDGRTDECVDGCVTCVLCASERASERACVVWCADHQKVRARCGVGVCRVGVCCHTSAVATAADPDKTTRTSAHAHTHAERRGGQECTWLGGDSRNAAAAAVPARLAAGSDSTEARFAATRGHRAVGGGHMGTWDKPKRREGRQQPPGARIRRGPWPRRPQSAFALEPRAYVCGASRGRGFVLRPDKSIKKRLG